MTTIDIFVRKAGYFTYQGTDYKFEEGCPLFENARTLSGLPKDNDFVQNLFKKLISKYVEKENRDDIN